MCAFFYLENLGVGGGVHVCRRIIGQISVPGRIEGIGKWLWKSTVQRWVNQCWKVVDTHSEEEANTPPPLRVEQLDCWYQKNFSSLRGFSDWNIMVWLLNFSPQLVTATGRVMLFSFKDFASHVHKLVCDKMLINCAPKHCHLLFWFFKNRFNR